MTTQDRKPEPTAAEAYAARRGDIARLLDVLAMELDAHAKRAAVAETNWGYAGDLHSVRRDLIGVVAFMSGMEIEEVEHFLDDAE